MQILLVNCRLITDVTFCSWGQSEKSLCSWVRSFPDSLSGTFAIEPTEKLFSMPFCLSVFPFQPLTGVMMLLTGNVYFIKYCHCHHYSITIYNNFIIFSNCLLFCILCTVIICTVLATSRCKCLVWGRGTLPFSPMSIYFVIFCFFLLFPFFHWLYLFSSFVHSFPFYQNSPTPFPAWRS